MDRATWKASEREFAEKLGGTRVPVNGRQRGSAPDIEHTFWAIEHKAGVMLSARMQEALDQAQKSAIGTTKTPLVTIDHMRGRGKARIQVVMLTLTDFVALTEMAGLA